MHHRICYQFSCKHLLIVRNLDIVSIHFFVVAVFENFLQEYFHSSATTPKKWGAVAVLDIHRSLTCGSSFCNVGGCKSQIYLKILRRKIFQSQLFKVTNKGKPPSMIFSLACNLLKMDAYSNDFQNIFLAKNSCDCNQIRSKWKKASVNALNHFHFNKLKRYQRSFIKDNS